MAEIRENVIEWLDGDKVMSVTLHQTRYINRVRKLAETCEDVRIIAENKDGSIFAHLPISCLKLTQKRQVNLDESAKSELAERMRKLNKQRADRNEGNEDYLEPYPDDDYM